MAADIHALIEKPLARDVQGAQKLAEAFEQAGLVGRWATSSATTQHFRACVDDWRPASWATSTRSLPDAREPFPARIADVGVIKDLATHDIDLTSWVAQQPYASVAARTAHKSGREHEDLVAVTGQLADGTVISHLVNWLSPMKERVTVVTGDRGTFVADTLNADLTFHANGIVPTEWDDIARFRGVTEGDVIRFAIAKPEPLRTEHEAFRDAVWGKNAEIVTMGQGLATVAVAEGHGVGQVGPLDRS